MEFGCQGEWVGRSKEFTLAVQTSLGSAAVQTEIERQAGRLMIRGIAFLDLLGEGLTNLLHELPAFIDDWFGRAWVDTVAGSEAAWAEVPGPFSSLHVVGW